MRNENPHRIKLKSPKVVVQEKKVSELTLVRIVDIPGQRIVRAFVNELPSPIVLWSGDEYDKIGDWTQAQANARVAELVA